MIIVGSNLKCADNSGCKRAKCIGLLKNKNVADVGDIIVISVKKVSSRFSKVVKGKVYRAVVVRVKKKRFSSYDGTFIMSNENAVVILGSAGDIIGTRVFGPVSRTLKKNNFSKILSLSLEVV